VVRGIGCQAYRGALYERSLLVLGRLEVPVIVGEDAPEPRRGPVPLPPSQLSR